MKALKGVTETLLLLQTGVEVSQIGEPKMGKQTFAETLGYCLKANMYAWHPDEHMEAGQYACKYTLLKPAR